MSIRVLFGSLRDSLTARNTDGLRSALAVLTALRATPRESAESMDGLTSTKDAPTVPLENNLPNVNMEAPNA